MDMIINNKAVRIAISSLILVLIGAGVVALLLSPEPEEPAFKDNLSRWQAIDFDPCNYDRMKFRISTTGSSEAVFNGEDEYIRYYHNEKLDSETYVVGGVTYHRNMLFTEEWDDWEIGNRFYTFAEMIGESHSDSPDWNDRVFCYVEGLTNHRFLRKDMIYGRRVWVFAADFPKQHLTGEHSYRHYEFWVDLSGRLHKTAIEHREEVGTEDGIIDETTAFGERFFYPNEPIEIVLPDEVNPDRQ